MSLRLLPLDFLLSCLARPLTGFISRWKMANFCVKHLAYTSLYLRSHPIAQSLDSLDHLITTHYCWDTSICYLVSDLCDNTPEDTGTAIAIFNQQLQKCCTVRIAVAGDSEIWSESLLLTVKSDYHK
jgi:hypothetical protein